jgi:ribosome-associated protein
MNFLELATRIAAAALDKKAENLVAFDLRGLSTYTDCQIIVSGTSDRQVQAIADGIEENLRKAGQKPLGVEGYSEGQWVLLDFGEVIVHVFHHHLRDFYDLEGLWSDAPRMTLVEEPSRANQPTLY